MGVVAYGLGMPARKRPTAQDTATARRLLLDGLAQGTGIFELVSELAPLHPRNNTFPGEVFLRLAADVLDRAAASRTDPVALEGIRERFLPECNFRGREKRKLQFAALSAAALNGGSSLTYSTRSHGGRQTTSGSTHCLPRSPISGSSPTGRTCPCPRYATTWPSARPHRLSDPGHPAPAPKMPQKDPICTVAELCELISNPHIRRVGALLFEVCQPDVCGRLPGPSVWVTGSDPHP
jgi:hypothetical protein